MTEPLPNLPASFEHARDVAHTLAPDDNLVTGTVVEVGTYPHFERGKSSIFLMLTLDPNKFGIESARAFVTPGASNLVGRRVRGLLMLDDEAQRDITKHGITGYNWKYQMMRHNPGVYYDPRTAFLDVDDPVLKVTGNVVRENLNVFGITHIDEDYYTTRGYTFDEAPEIEVRVNPFKRLWNSINAFKRPAATDKPQLEHHP